MIDQSVISGFVEIVGEANALTPDDDLTHYTHENRGLFVGKTPLILKPSSTEEVARIVKLAAAERIAIVPQGGHTGHVGGAVPDESGTQIVVSLERLNKIREVDLEGNVVVCEAGVVLETIQKTADDQGRLFPLALGSQGSCQIGGNISTNAGGTGVLAYGNTRQLVMGLEVVLPSGEVWNGLRRLKKDNTGYDLKDLFIGAEGTLGIVTAAVLKLFPKPRGKAVAFCGMETADHALQLFQRAESLAGTGLTAFELMAQVPIEFTLKNMENVRNPLTQKHSWYVLMEISSNKSESEANELLESLLADALGENEIRDAALSASLSDLSDFWRIREMMPLAQKFEGGSMKHDISLPIHLVPEFLKRADRIVIEEIPDARLCTFGHLGDGNIHYNISQPVDANTDEFLARQPEINALIHKLVVSMEGSVAAEHGIGRLKRELLQETKSSTELELMQSIKNALDPNNIMNPGKVI